MSSYDTYDEYIEHQVWSDEDVDRDPDAYYDYLELRALERDRLDYEAELLAYPDEEYDYDL